MNWFKLNIIPVFFCTVTGLIAALAIMFNMWQGEHRIAEEYKHISEVQGQVITATSRIHENETHVNRITEHTVERIMESPNANTPVPPDIAAAWADGIDSVWGDRTIPTDRSVADVSGPASGTSRRGNSDSGRIKRVLGSTGSSTSEVQ